MLSCADTPYMNSIGFDKSVDLLVHKSKGKTSVYMYTPGAIYLEFKTYAQKS